VENEHYTNVQDVQIFFTRFTDSVRWQGKLYLAQFLVCGVWLQQRAVIKFPVSNRHHACSKQYQQQCLLI